MREQNKKSVLACCEDLPAHQKKKKRTLVFPREAHSQTTCTRSVVTEVSPFSTAGVESLCLRQELGYYANTGASEAYVKTEMWAVVGNLWPECVCVLKSSCHSQSQTSLHQSHMQCDDPLMIIKFTSILTDSLR